jgi:hypothetical protein
MKELEQISSALFEKIRTRFDNVKLGDENSKATTDPEQAKFFNFDYTVNGKKIGNITISLIDETSLKVYYSKDIVDRLHAVDSEDDGEEESAESQWYDFLSGLRKFAKRNMLGFDARDIAKSNLELKDIRQQSRNDATLSTDDISVTEGRMYGTTRRSYQECGPVKIVIRHISEVDEEKRGARTRNIENVFLETHLGERFLLPEKNLHYARAMARHVSEGGRIDDELGGSITAMCQEMKSMVHFVREANRRQFEDRETDEMARSAVNRYQQLKGQLRHLHSRRGYLSYQESYTPDPDIEEEVDIADLRERFVRKVYNDRFDDALPYVARAYKRQRESAVNGVAEEFANWANELAEGTWAAPDDDVEVRELDDIMSQKQLRAGNNGNDAIGQLYDIIGDDELYDRIAARASEEGPDADCRPDVMEWLRDHDYADLAEKYTQNYTQDSAPLAAQDATVAQQQADTAAQNQQYGSVGTAEPSPVANTANEDTDPLDFLRSLAGLKK